MEKYKVSVIIQKDKDGYFAFCPELPGCYTQGNSFEEILGNIKDAVKLYIEDMIESGEEIPKFEAITISQIEVTL